MAPHSSTLAWKLPWTEEPGRLQSMGSLESDMAERLHFHFSLSWSGEGNGNPLQCSCLENPRDGGAWWAAVCGVTQSQTRLKRLSSSLFKGIWTSILAWAAIRRHCGLDGLNEFIFHSSGLWKLLIRVAACSGSWVNSSWLKFYCSKRYHWIL